MCVVYIKTQIVDMVFHAFLVFLATHDDCNVKTRNSNLIFFCFVNAVHNKLRLASTHKTAIVIFTLSGEQVFFFLS